MRRLLDIRSRVKTTPEGISEHPKNEKAEAEVPTWADKARIFSSYRIH